MFRIFREATLAFFSLWQGSAWDPVILPVFKTGGRPYGQRCVRLARASANMGNQREIDKHRCQRMACRLLRSAFQSVAGSTFSISTCVLCQVGRARASRRLPLSVRTRTRLRRSAGSFRTLTRPRRCSGFRAAVSVVRSMASREATGPIGGGSGRLRDISKENCPFVSPWGRSASSKRRARTRAARCV